MHYPVVLVSLRWFKQGQYLPVVAALLLNRMWALFEGPGNRCGRLNDAQIERHRRGCVQEDVAMLFGLPLHWFN